MDEVGKWPTSAAIFGSSGAIGKALCETLLERGCRTVLAVSRDGTEPVGDGIIAIPFDLTSEASIAKAASEMASQPPQITIVASGVLTLADGTGPERSYKRLDPKAMAEVFALNTIGPALIAKHCLPLLPRDRRSVFAVLSARVGSISDNGLGGWHSYRASKAALNMLIKNFALEIERTHPQGVVIGLHPGTVDSALSEPFQKGLREGQLTEPSVAAANLLNVLCQCTPQQSGSVLDFAGKVVPA